MFISILVILFLVSIVRRNILYIKELVIPTKKTYWDGMLVMMIILMFIVITLIYGKQLIHYFTGILAIVYIILEFFKQGISNDGIIIMERGKGIYNWEELSKVEIKKGKNIKVTYLGKEGLIVTHKFSLDKYKKLVDMFISNGVEYEIKYK